MNAPSELNIAIVGHNKAAKQPAALLKLARPNAQAPMNEDEASVSFRTVLGR
jgi:hypothetical protein